MRLHIFKKRESSLEEFDVVAVTIRWRLHIFNVISVQKLRIQKMITRFEKLMSPWENIVASVKHHEKITSLRCIKCVRWVSKKSFSFFASCSKLSTLVSVESGRDPVCSKPAFQYFVRGFHCRWGIILCPVRFLSVVIPFLLSNVRFQS